MMDATKNGTAEASGTTKSTKIPKGDTCPLAAMSFHVSALVVVFLVSLVSLR